MMSKMDEVFRKVLNDREIFDSPYDRNAREPIPKLFEGKEWKELEQLFNEERKSEFVEKIDSRIREIEDQERRARGWRRERIKELKQRAEWLKSAFNNKPYLLKQLFVTLEWYGLVECKLPNMENYGKVIEKHEISMVKEYFCDKIHRTCYPQNKALEKVFEYVKELYDAGIPLEKIAYSVRKLNSLTKYWEVIE